jgi:hypothetical protein
MVDFSVCPTVLARIQPTHDEVDAAKDKSQREVASKQAEQVGLISRQCVNQAETREDNH